MTGIALAKIKYDSKTMTPLGFYQNYIAHLLANVTRAGQVDSLEQYAAPGLRQGHSTRHWRLHPLQLCEGDRCSSHQSHPITLPLEVGSRKTFNGHQSRYLC